MLMEFLDRIRGWIPWDGIPRTIDSITGLPVAQTSIGGAVPVTVKSSDVALPEQWYKEGLNSAVSAVVVATDCYESPDITSLNCTVIEVVVAPTGTTPKIQAVARLNGANYSVTPLAFINLTDGSIISGATGLTAIGIYALMQPVGGGIKYRGMKLQLVAAASGALSAGNIRILHGKA